VLRTWAVLLTSVTLGVAGAVGVPAVASAATVETAQGAATVAQPAVAEDRVASPLSSAMAGLTDLARDRINRDALGTAISELQQQAADRAARSRGDANVSTRLHMLRQVQAALVPGDSRLPRRLLSLDSEGQGRAVVVVGDLATADYVTYLVPGMFYSVDAQIRNWTEVADQLAAQQQRWLAWETSATGAAAPTVAVVAWIGYHAPTFANIATTDAAEEGADALVQGLDELFALRAGDAPHVTVVGHSYGSTTAMIALSGGRVEVDDLVVLGSPGGPVASAAELDAADGVWVGAAAWDPIATLGYYGSQPGSAEFGARALGVGGGVDAVTGLELSGAAGHNDYFVPGGETLRNLAVVGIDRGDLVSADGAPPTTEAGAGSVLAAG
jgi:pimeloyl-ACP methyl ester carboxylesterase